jgi:PAS domain S-box-containing protein
MATRDRLTKTASGAQSLLGWRRDEIIDRHFVVFFPDEALLRGDPRAHLRITAMETRFTERALRIRKDGSSFMAVIELRALYKQKGDVRGFVNVFRHSATL